MTSQYQENTVLFKLCERCGKLILIHQVCECYNELSKPSIRAKAVSMWA